MSSWEGVEEGPRRWRTLGPGLVVLVLGGLLAVTGLPDRGADDGLLVENGGDAPGEDEAPGEDDGRPDRPTPGPPTPDPPEVEASPPGAADQPEDAEPVEALPDTEGTLYALGRRRIARVDLATGERHVREVSGLTADTGPFNTLVVSDEHVVVTRGQTAPLVLRHDLEGEPVVLDAVTDGARNTFVSQVFPGPEAGAATFVVRHDTRLVLRVIDLELGQAIRDEELPAGASVLDVSGPQVVVGVAGGIFLYDLETGRAEHLTTGAPLAAAGRLVVYVRCAEDLDCDLVVHEIGEAEGERLAEAPQAYFGTWPQGLSPDGRWLRLPLPAGPPGWELIDLSTGRSVQPPASDRAPRGPTASAWTPDGAWLLDAGMPAVRAWRPDDGTVLELDLEISGVDAIAVAP